jgi:hypothetical protein
LKAAFRARKRGRFERLFTVFFLCNGSAIKGRGVSSIGSNAYSLKAAVTTGSGLIKGKRSEPTMRGNRARHREETQQNQSKRDTENKKNPNKRK